MSKRYLSTLFIIFFLFSYTFAVDLSMSVSDLYDYNSYVTLKKDSVIAYDSVLTKQSDYKFSVISSAIIGGYKELKNLPLTSDVLVEFKNKFSTINPAVGYYNIPDKSDFIELLNSFNSDCIMNTLSDNEYLVNYIYNKDITSYSAYIISKDTIVKYDNIFADSDIDSIGVPVDSICNYYLHTNSVKLRKIVWDSLSKEIPNNNRVYYVPDGFLNNIALESLMLNDTLYLDDEYDFVRLHTTALNLFQYKDTIKLDSNSRVVLYGDIDYGKVEKEGNLCRLLRTSFEINSIGKFLKRSFKCDTILYTGTFATKESLMQLSDSVPDILYISTHAETGKIFLAGSNDVLNGKRGNTLYTGVNDAMIVLAKGANTISNPIKTNDRQTLGKGVEQGCITVEDVEKLKLYGLDLVVISACDSGLGELTEDGQLGLVRAFKKAGANTVITAKWKLNEKSAMFFMTCFFEKFSNNGGDKHKAFKYAKKQTRKKYVLPEDWAPFVMDN